MAEEFGPVGPGSEMVGRKVTNAFGVLETAVMPDANWEYFDWCVSQGWDMQLWTMAMDRKRKPTISFSDNIWGGLWKLACSRYKQGLSCPPNSPPDGYQEFLEEVERGDYEELIFPKEELPKED